MSAQLPEHPELNTGGGAFVEGTVRAGRDFIGRDQINNYPRSQREKLDDYLRRAIAAYEADLSARRHPPTPDQPYKFLYPFTMADQAIFFGRNAALAQSLEKVDHSSRLTALHAPSGAGKSSLLGAGLMPRLLDQNRLPLYVAVHQDAADPVLAIKKALTPESNGPWPELLPRLSLSAYLGEVTRHMGRRFRELVVLLDQFEAFFVFSSEAAHRQSFIDALADCLQDESLPIRVVIALRKDYYSDLAYFEGRLPHIFHNQYLLRPMDRSEVQSAITGPVAKVNPDVTFEDKLLDALLNDLARREVGLPHLQIVCTQLYEDRGQTGTLTLAAYDALGRTEGVLGRYLQRVLDEMGDQRSLTEGILNALITSQGTKRVLDEDALARELAVERSPLEPVLARLVDRRLLQRSQDDGVIHYQIAHESLGVEIQSWIDPEQLALKQAQELLAAEVAAWHVHGTLIPKERLDLLYPHRKFFKGMDGEMLRCLVESAVAADSAVEEWTVLAGSVGEKALIQTYLQPYSINALSSVDVRKTAEHCLIRIWGWTPVSKLSDEDPHVREAAAWILGKWGDARAVEPLIVALTDQDTQVRQTAAWALGGIGDERAVVPLIALLRDKNVATRRTAVTSLGKIGSERAVEPLIATLGDKDENVRNEAVWALSDLGEHAVGSLLAALEGENRFVWWGVARALGNLGDERAVEPLIAVLGNYEKDEGKDVRYGAAAALGKLDDERAVEPLIAAMEDEDQHVRGVAAQALGNLGDERAVEPLVIALRDENGYVRQAAVWGLDRLAGARAVKPLISVLKDEESAVRHTALRALVRIGEPAVKPLIQALTSESVAIRQNAAKALGDLQVARAVDTLIHLLSDESRDVRWSAAEALRSIGTPEARAAVKHYRHQPL